MDDAGYYNGGSNDEAAWSGGGVVLIVHNKPSKPKITGDLNVEVNRYIALTCSSQSSSAPDYYSKLVTLSYTWFVNETKMGRETGEILRFYVTRDLKYNRYSCTATEDDLESERSDTVHINPLCKFHLNQSKAWRLNEGKWNPYPSILKDVMDEDGPDRIKITPEPVLNVNGNLTVREGETIGPFVCTADCNPPCNISWKVKDPDGFSDALSEMRTLMQQAVQRNIQLFGCIAHWKDKMFQKNLDISTIYINDVSSSNVEVSENATLRISCHVDGNPIPTLRLSRVQADTELDERQGAWLNYTIDTAQCTDTDTYRCRGTSTGFNNREKVFSINVPCNISFDSGDDETSRPYIVAIALLSFLLGLTWLIVALVVIYKRRHHSVHQNSKHGDESIQPEETLNMTQQYDDVHDMVADKLEAQNMSQDYDDVQGTVAEGNYTNANGDNTVIEDSYTELGRRDPETPYEEFKA
uniref:Ig-like domain-containing protein n=1 Tax=Magallana gigas TaxID=29159 RepID=K1R8Y2_MAGGI